MSFFKLAKTHSIITRWGYLFSIRLFCICSFPEEVEDPDEDQDALTDFALIDISRYREKKGISFVWFFSPSEDPEIWGRSLLGFYTHYGKPVLEIFWIRIMLF
jgi:hypothetical protein